MYVFAVLLNWLLSVKAFIKHLTDQIRFYTVCRIFGSARKQVLINDFGQACLFSSIVNHLTLDVSANEKNSP